jgi:hypothetical protein
MSRFIFFRVPSRCVPDELANSTARNIAYACRHAVSCSRGSQLGSPIFSIPDYFLPRPDQSPELPSCRPARGVAFETIMLLRKQCHVDANDVDRLHPRPARVERLGRPLSNGVGTFARTRRTAGTGPQAVACGVGRAQAASSRSGCRSPNGTPPFATAHERIAPAIYNLIVHW